MGDDKEATPAMIRCPHCNEWRPVVVYGAHCFEQAMAAGEALAEIISRREEQADG